MDGPSSDGFKRPYKEVPRSAGDFPADRFPHFHRSLTRNPRRSPDSVFSLRSCMDEMKSKGILRPGSLRTVAQLMVPWRSRDNFMNG